MEKRPQVCLSLNCSNIDELISELEMYSAMADMFELRVDTFDNFSSFTDMELMGIFTTLKNYIGSKELIVTCRAQFGIESRVLNLAIGVCDYIDITFGNPEMDKLAYNASLNGVKVILSYHNYIDTPPKEYILDKIEEMESFEHDILKVAYKANSEDDCKLLMDACEGRDMIAISMGKYGQESRIHGSVITYAAGTMGTAPGQIRIDELVKVLDEYYRN